MYNDDDFILYTEWIYYSILSWTLIMYEVMEKQNKIQMIQITMNFAITMVLSKNKIHVVYIYETYVKIKKEILNVF